MRKVLVCFTLFFILLSQTDCASNKNASNGAHTQPQSGKNSPNAAPAIEIKAADLIEAYRMEEADGAGKYKGKTLAVTGTVSRTGRDFLDRLYVDLKAENNSVIEVHCTYNDSEKDSMSAVKAGQEVTIRGVCDGRLSTWVVLKDCVLQ